jgi:anhydro-N-acetylmuramic acid kinase
VADFRSNDIALGGEGAPLVPPFHEWLLRDPGEDRVVLNIGGIANITILPSADNLASGFDTGPGNTLLDAWSRQVRDLPYDDEGQWAASGQVDEQLLAHCLDDPWFGKKPPKSTGFETFNLDWLRRFPVHELDAADVQATLAAVTAISIADAIRRWAPATRRVFVCGGGARNLDVLRRVAEYLPDCQVQRTDEKGLPADWVEAAAFAWLAMRRIDGQPGNLPAVTGATRRTALGAIYLP